MAGLVLRGLEASSGPEGWPPRAGTEHPVRRHEGLQVPGGPAAAETQEPKRAQP